MNIGFIGCGRIARPMVTALSRRLPDAQIRVSQRNAAISARLAAELSNVTVAENQAVLEHSEALFICLPAETARQILPGLGFRSSHQVVSVMAGIGLSELEFLTMPATDPCIAVPLPFIDQGRCPLPVFPASRLLEHLFGADNEVQPLTSESALSPHFVATTMLSLVMTQLAEASDWLSNSTGQPQAAERYIALLMTGYFNSLKKDGQSRFTQAVKELSTDDGLNHELLRQITTSGHFKHLREKLDTLHNSLSNPL